MERFVGFRCKSCGRVSYPKRARCLGCRGREFEEVELDKECRLLTYTKLYAVPSGVERIPLVLGIVEFKNGARALGQIMSEEVEVDMKLTPEYGPLRKIRGRDIFGFRFRPIG